MALESGVVVHFCIVRSLAVMLEFLSGRLLSGSLPCRPDAGSELVWCGEGMNRVF